LSGSGFSAATLLKSATGPTTSAIAPTIRLRATARHLSIGNSTSGVFKGGNPLENSLCKASGTRAGAPLDPIWPSAHSAAAAMRHRHCRTIVPNTDASVCVKCSARLRANTSGSGSWQGTRRAVLEAPSNAIEIQVDHRRAEQGQHLRHDQATHNRPTQRLAKFRPGAIA